MCCSPWDHKKLHRLSDLTELNDWYKYLCYLSLCVFLCHVIMCCVFGHVGAFVWCYILYLYSYAFIAIHHANMYIIFHIYESKYSVL